MDPNEESTERDGNTMRQEMEPALYYVQLS